MYAYTRAVDRIRIFTANRDVKGETSRARRAPCARSSTNGTRVTRVAISPELSIKSETRVGEKKGDEGETFPFCTASFVTTAREEINSGCCAGDARAVSRACALAPVLVNVAV